MFLLDFFAQLVNLSADVSRAIYVYNKDHVEYFVRAFRVFRGQVLVLLIPVSWITDYWLIIL